MDTCRFCKIEFQKNYKKQKCCSLLCSNRYNKNGLHRIFLPRNSIDLAEFIGIVAGDGNVSHYHTCIALNSIVDADYVTYVTNLSKMLFSGASVTVRQKTNENVTIIQISSRIVADFLKSMGMIPYKKVLPCWILEGFDFSKACVRGLIDTEGSISYKLYKSITGMRAYKQLNFRNANRGLMIFVRDVLRNLGLQPTDTTKRSLYLSNHQSIEVYRKEIGFNNPKLIKRSLVTDYPSYLNWRGTEVAITGQS